MKQLDNKEIKNLWNMVFNLSLQMLQDEEIAMDATQSIFEIVYAKIDSFRGESRLSTWVYRISYNYLIDEKRKSCREKITFGLFEKDITNFQDYRNELNLSREEEKIFVEEIKIGCTKALLQCLSPKDRFVFILGTVFDFPRKMAAEICGLSYDNYRKKLSRVKHRIKSFLSKNCGLMNPAAKCSCGKRLLIAKERGRISLEKSLYRSENQKIKNYISEMNELDHLSRIFGDNPFIEISGEEISRKIQKLGILQEDFGRINGSVFP